VSGEDALEMLHFASQLRVARARQSVRPPRRIDVAVIELDAREVAGRPAARFAGRHGSRLARGTRLGRTLRRNLFQEAAPVKRLDARAPEPPHPKREPLQRRVRILQLFEHQHGELREPQLAGQEEADRAGPGDDYVVDHGLTPSS